MSRRHTQDQIETVFAEAGADIEKIRRLRRRIRELQEEAGDHEEPDVLAEATSKAFEVIRILVDEGLLKTRHLGPDSGDGARLMAVLEANLAYLQETLKTFAH